MPPIPKSAAVVAGGVVISAIALPLIVALLGFGTGGVIAGTLAAGTQAGIGNVAAGSAFAVMQTVGTAPLTTALYAGLAGGTIAGAGVGVVAVVEHLDSIKAGVHWIEEAVKSAVGKVDFGMIKAGGRWIEVSFLTVKSAVVGTVDFDALGHQISQSTGIIAGSAQNALAGMVKAMGELPTPDAAAKGVASAIGALDIPSTAQNAAKDVVSAIEALNIPSTAQNAAKDVVSAIEALNVTSTAHHAVENIVGEAKNAFGDALGKIASIIHD